MVVVVVVVVVVIVYLDVVGYDGDILEIECSVYLIHDVEWRRFVMM